MPKPQKPLKIGLILDTSLDLEDGVQQYVMTVGEWLRSQGHDVHYLVGQTDKRQLPNIHSLSRNVVVKFNGNRINLPLLANRKHIRKLLKQEQFDVLHVQTPHHPLMAQRVILAAGPQTAIVATFHILPYSFLVRLANVLLGLTLRPSLKRIDQMLAVTPAAARFERQTFRLPAMVLPNAFDYPRFHAAQPFGEERSGIPAILFLGRLVPRKGCLTLLRAVADLAAQPDAPEFRVLICGKGPLEPDLRQFVASRQLEDIVEFAGFVSDEDKPRFYASADIAVFPSSGGESFGIVLLEAMANGQTAVLAGKNPGYDSVMEPQPDLLFDTHDVAELAAKIKNLLINPRARRQYGRWGEEYTQQFDIDVVGRKLESLYRDLLNRKKLQ
jgi:phosphatidylinositol alpha-mannosyltransferase